MQNVNIDKLSFPPPNRQRWDHNFKSSDFLLTISRKIKQFFFKSKSVNDVFEEGKKVEFFFKNSIFFFLKKKKRKQEKQTVMNM